ncbi:MAG: hypothetical protein IJ205_06985 [Bacteroidales bacterium]|nr:hypothetical protein [Bacteroidales bacterium]
MKKILIFLCAALLIGPSGCSRSSLVEIGNDCASLGFDRQTGRLVSFVEKSHSREFIDPSAVTSLPWRLDPAEPGSFDQETGYKVTFRKHGRDCIDIFWEYGGESPLEVKMTVSLEKDRPLSHWRASFKGLQAICSDGVTYPVVSGLREYANADLVLPTWLGILTHDPAEGATAEKPARYSRSFPGSSMQLMALYDREELKNGLYFSSQDTTSMSKTMVVSFVPGSVEFKATCRVPDKTETDCFSPGYDVVVGSFDGDWVAASAVYRTWAVEQKFCRESRFRNGDCPSWLPETAFWIWNRGRSENVLKEAEDIQARLSLPVNAYWHWWHGCPYDEGFPEYVPPKEGRESFIKAVEHAHKQGIHSLVYMNSYQWGDSTESWKEEGAEEYAARKEDGSTYRHVYEIFSGNGLTPMCMATQFWRDNYSSLCDTVVNHYHVDGVYMDQACNSMPCYDPDHGHTLGGGNYWREGFGKLTDQIRGTFAEGSDAILAGEGSAEDWLPVLDDFLTLQPSHERYSGVGKSEPVPLFQAVYHDYAMTYGSYSSLVYPPYDELWPKEFYPSNAETLLPEEFNMQFRMEQARSFTWGMQPTLANYHSFLFEKRKSEMEFLVDLIRTRYNALDYLLYGRFIGIPALDSEEITIPISKVSIYAGRKGDTVTRYEKTIKTLFSSAWLTKEGSLGIAVSNILDTPAEVDLEIDPEQYGIPSTGSINMITSEGKKSCGSYSGKGEFHFRFPARSSCVIEFAK